MFQPEEILPRQTQQHDSLPLWQKWHKKTLKPGWPEKGLRKTIPTICFFTHNYSLLFTEKKKTSNTVR
ncbi:hypothetical protein B1Q45_12320 [Salmonella enterica]|uniref:Uncharacterized protein n=1 Tax=Salmonella enterica subsp. arizonae serovar 18:z4,z23:- TaxID=1192839 RepID=A0A5Z6PJB7_SALER|nr:hypothetical protein [Salmonella enterica]EBV8290311.1 hypothetical protein [Salmonella enterica subsp. arizonae serovar 18:z4,z23:-]EBV9432333.1 hypothetical protein [Salmonella enterica subsp. enterica serovar Heidelberg]ECC3303046.1 hypothetical protein [Salmonella enterica subsp. arizonae]ECE0068972.1 hypothetical protein [Salmonella enterica subsp. enterica]ECU7350134.1 hypothetical protein [Salmonella enterica subsp. enterica serovar Kentucky]EDB5611268.1 hypothetical protein [Salmon